MEDLQFSAEEARRFYDFGRIAAADVVCRGTLVKNPADAAARRLLAQIAQDIGEHETASRILAEGGLPAMPSAAPAGWPAAWPGVFAAEQKFLLIKAWGNGFCSDLDQVLGMLLLAEMSGRTPVVHWGRNCMFGVDREADAWREYFLPVSPHTIDDLSGKGYDFWPPKWNDANLRVENLNKLDGAGSRLSGIQMLNRPERVVVSDYYTGVPNLSRWLRPNHQMFNRPVTDVHRYLVAKYLRPQPEIMAAVERFAAERMPPGPPIIAAHIRASDKLTEDADLPKKIAQYPALLAQLASRHGGAGGAARVFLLTDSTTIREEYAARLGASLISTDCTRTQTQTGLHYQQHADRKRLGVEVLTDCLLAARCDSFVGLGSSNVTCFIYHLKPWTAQNSTIIGPMMTQMMNAFLWMSHDQLDRYLPESVMTSLRRKALLPPLES